MGTAQASRKKKSHFEKGDQPHASFTICKQTTFTSTNYTKRIDNSIRSRFISTAPSGHEVGTC